MPKNKRNESRREEVESLSHEFSYLCDLSQQANDLWNALDFREGLAILDNNEKHIKQCARLKVLCRRRRHRRSGKASVVWEEREHITGWAHHILIGTPARMKGDECLL